MRKTGLSSTLKNQSTLIMKKVLLTLAVVFGGFILAGAQEVVNGPVLSLDKEVHDYGTIDQGADGNCVFTVTNDGTDPAHYFSLQGFMWLHCSSV